METKQTPVHTGDAESGMPSCCGKRSNAERVTLNEDDTTKRNRNDASIVASSSTFDDPARQTEELKLIVDDLPSEVNYSVMDGNG